MRGRFWMNFNEHYIDGHAFLSPSTHSWINYDDDRLIDRFQSWQATQRGTQLHELAEQLIRMRVKVEHKRRTFNMYVNDAIKYGMTPEQPLVYSENCFGTADAISFEHNFLRIHDLKTGVTKASMDQLKIYMALFCLEYEYSADGIKAELRIYQSNDIVVCKPDPVEIDYIMSTIVHADAIIKELRRTG